MKMDPLKAYLNLRQKLQQERTALDGRLQQINQALSHSPTAVSASPAARKFVRQGQNRLSLPQAVVQVTSAKSLTKPEILQAVQKLGYRFSTREPMKSLNPVLYGKKPRFIRKDGRFSPARGAASQATKLVSQTKRKVSAGTRAKLKALAKARWAKAKAAGKTRL